MLLSFRNSNSVLCVQGGAVSQVELGHGGDDILGHVPIVGHVVPIVGHDAPTLGHVAELRQAAMLGHELEVESAALLAECGVERSVSEEHSDKIRG